MKNDFKRILNNVGQLISLEPSEVDFYTSLLEIRKLKRREFLFRQDNICKYEFYVNKGCLRNFTIDKNGIEHIDMFAIEDWYTGDLYSFMTETPSSANIQALEASEIFAISKVNWERLLIEIPKFEKFYRIRFQNSLISHSQRLMENLSEPAEARYLRFRKKYPIVEQRVPQKYIAAYLGITPEFLSMIRRKLAKEPIS